MFMQKNLFISLSLLILLGLIVSVGCGGGGGDSSVVQSVSLTTPTPGNQKLVGYINITVEWPGSGAAGRCLLSSGSDNKITASFFL